MSHPKYVKSSGERKRYTIDYTDWLDTGEGVVSVAFTIPENTASSPLVVDDVEVLPTALGAQFYVSGGLDGEQYAVLATLTTTLGPQTKVDEIIYVVREP